MALRAYNLELDRDAYVLFMPPEIAASRSIMAPSSSLHPPHENELSVPCRRSARPCTHSRVRYSPNSRGKADPVNPDFTSQRRKTGRSLSATKSATASHLCKRASAKVSPATLADGLATAP